MLPMQTMKKNTTGLQTNKTQQILTWPKTIILSRSRYNHINIQNVILNTNQTFHMVVNNKNVAAAAAYNDVQNARHKLYQILITSPIYITLKGTKNDKTFQNKVLLLLKEKAIRNTKV